MKNTENNQSHSFNQSLEMQMQVSRLEKTVSQMNEKLESYKTKTAITAVLVVIAFAMLTFISLNN